MAHGRTGSSPVTRTNIGNPIILENQGLWGFLFCSDMDLSLVCCSSEKMRKYNIYKLENNKKDMVYISLVE